MKKSFVNLLIPFAAVVAMLLPAFTAAAHDLVQKPEAPIEGNIPIKVDQVPTFEGGNLETFHDWVMSRVVYPDLAKENGISGCVMVSLVVEKDGSLGDITILRSPDSSLSEEALRVINSSPKWTPGKIKNRPVRVKYILPVNFKLDN